MKANEKKYDESQKPWDCRERERERERERVSLYSTWNSSTRPHTLCLVNKRKQNINRRDVISIVFNDGIYISFLREYG